jgi:pimeloyl-ACP methyl ester carboxylesterase
VSLPAFVEQGQGDVVLLLHGIGGGKSIWGESLGALAAAGYRAVAMDFPGYGDSPGSPTLQAMVDAVLVLLDHLGAERSALVGHSMGGMVAQELVAGAPRRVQAQVLACTSSAFGKPDGDWQARFVAERLAPLDAGLGMAGMAAKLVPGMVAPGTAAAALEASMAVMARVPEATYRTALRAIAAFDRRAALADIRIPTLCLAGAHDRTAPPDVMQRMALRIAGAEYRCLSDAGHIANVEQPEEFNAATIEFLRRALP